MIMIKSEKWKTIFKSKSLIYIVIAFAVALVLINLGLVITDIIYEKMGFTLTAQGLTENVYLSQQDLQSIKEQVKNLEKSKLRLEEMNIAISEIQKEIDYINKDARPKFIRYCKIYIDMKKEHARELRKTGNIQYNKMNEKL